MIVFNALQTTLSGGIGRYSYELSKALYKIENNIKIVIRKEDLSLFSFANKDDLIIIDNITSGAKRNIYEQFKLPFLINKLYPDAILHYPDSMAPLFSKNKVIITVHDIAFKSLKNVFTWKTKLWKNFITKLSVLKADKIIAISKFTKEEIINAYGIGVGDKTEVVLNGFNDFSKDEIKYDNIKKEILDLSDEKFILTVSTISPRKNIDGLIRAYNASKVKDNYKLVVAGSYGWMYEEVFNVVKELNISDRVIFTNKINDDELKYLYKNCDMLAYVSFYEGFGLPPLEAMSYGKPCMVSNKSSIPEVVGDAALLVNPASIDEMSEGIEKIVINYELKEKLSQLGLKNINRFSWENCASESRELYKSLLRY
jgi:glycosyltransferase involved in cell wall biosynthesis